MVHSMTEDESRFRLGSFDSRRYAHLERRSLSCRGDGREGWIAYTGASHHMTGSMKNIIDARPPHPDYDSAILGDGTVLLVRVVRSLQLRFHTGPTGTSEPSSFLY